MPIYIYPGGNAKNINTSQWGRINGFICTDTHIDSIENGIVYIDGATAAGDAYVFSGSFANNIYVSLSAKLFVCDGGATDNVHIIDRGSAYIYSGGCMSNTTVDYSGMLVIYDGGRLSGTTTVAANGSVNGFAMNSATNIIDDGSRIHISGAYIHEWSAFADSNLELSDIRVIGGVLEVDCDSEIQDISIEQNGTLIVHSGANINDVINTGGSVIVAEDATVNNFIQNNYSHEIVVMSGAEINDMLVAELGSAIISGDGIINNAIVERGCSITMSGGTLDGFKNDGVIDLSGSAVAKDGTVTDYIEISSGAQVSNIDVKSGGIVYVSSGGMLNQSFINGSATVWGGMAEQLVIGSGGDVDISGNSIVEQVVVNSAGKLSCLRSGYISDLTIKAGGQALLASGDGILVEYGGELYLSGTPEGINDITLAGGRLNIYSDPSSLPIYVKSITFALSGETADTMINVNISNITCSQYYL